MNNKNYKFSNKIYIEICNKCNLACKHCYNLSSSINNNFMDICLLKQIINNCKLNKIKHITISGGEPLLHPNIIEFINEIIESNMTTGIITNGTVLRYDLLSLLKRYKERVNLQVSLHGSTPKIHSKLTNTDVSSKVFDFLSVLHDEGIEYSINCVLNKHNMLDIENLIKLAKNKSAKKISIGFIQSFGRAINNKDDIIVPTPQLINYYNKDLMMLKNKYGDFLSLPEYKNTACPAVGNHIKNRENFFSPRIDSFGKVYLCSMFVSSKFSLGNISTQTLNEIFESDSLKDLLSYLNLREKYVDKCNDCYASNICGRGCPAVSAENDILSKNDYCSFAKIQILTNNLRIDRNSNDF